MVDRLQISLCHVEINIFDQNYKLHFQKINHIICFDILNWVFIFPLIPYIHVQNCIILHKDKSMFQWSFYKVQSYIFHNFMFLILRKLRVLKSITSWILITWNILILTLKQYFRRIILSFDNSWSTWVPFSLLNAWLIFIYLLILSMKDWEFLLISWAFKY